MSKHKLGVLLLTAALLGTTGLGGCANEVPVPSSGTSSTASTASAGSSDTGNLPEDGGFKTVSYELSKDKYRTFYEIFPYSFYDSDGSGVGDLNGITQKLDYLNDGDTKTTDDLGIDGIWLTPIMQSPSYHKYDVADYYTVDEAFGTNEDFKKLLDEAHKRGINVIIDLVINHSSNQHEWFKKALEELAEGKTDGYAAYYHFVENNKIDGWTKAGVGDWYYESDFVSEMPDLNLKNPALREELQKIVKYWLELGVDGFRLDAVMWFESIDGVKGKHDHDGSIEDLQWLYDYAKTVKEDVYMVGECWADSPSTIADYYKSGLDSLFNFGVQGSSGKINGYVNTGDAASYVQYLENWQAQITERNANAIDAKFLSNHDTVRSAEFMMNNSRQRMAAAMYILAPGNPYIYYGEEIAMEGVNPPDPDVRRGMYWSADDDTGYVKKIPGGTKLEEEPSVSVESALKDDESLMTYYKRIIALRNQNPEIARGTLKAITLDNNATAGYVSTYKDSSVMVVYNLGDESATVTIPSDAFKVSEVRGYVLAHDKSDDPIGGTAYDPTVKQDGQSLTMPAHSVFVLK